MNPYLTSTVGCILLAAGIVGSALLGHRVGRRRRAADNSDGELHTGTIDAAIFSLLGLLVAFTFANAYSRFEQRRQLLVSLSQNNCGPQYRAAANQPAPRPRGFLEQLFGGNDNNDAADPDVAPNTMPAGSTFRTVCVRMCDGFYFPVGDNVGRERLHQDARTCAARCDGEAALYYYPLNGGSVETMVDLRGQPYAQTTTAFLYRKTLVQGCTCKPAPWSAAIPRPLRRNAHCSTSKRSCDRRAAASSGFFRQRSM